jgi:hypothetical protein
MENEMADPSFTSKARVGSAVALESRDTVMEKWSTTPGFRNAIRWRSELGDGTVTYYYEIWGAGYPGFELSTPGAITTYDNASPDSIYHDTTNHDMWVKTGAAGSEGWKAINVIARADDGDTGNLGWARCAAGTMVLDSENNLFIKVAAVGTDTWEQVGPQAAE